MSVEFHVLSSLERSVQPHAPYQLKQTVLPRRPLFVFAAVHQKLSFRFASQHVAGQNSPVSHPTPIPRVLPRHIFLRPERVAKVRPRWRTYRVWLGPRGPMRTGSLLPCVVVVFPLPYIPGKAEVVVTYLWQARNLLIMVAEEMCRLFL